MRKCNLKDCETIANISAVGWRGVCVNARVHACVCGVWESIPQEDPPSLGEWGHVEEQAGDGLGRDARAWQSTGAQKCSVQIDRMDE